MGMQGEKLEPDELMLKELLKNSSFPFENHLEVYRWWKENQPVEEEAEG